MNSLGILTYQKKPTITPLIVGYIADRWWSYLLELGTKRLQLDAQLVKLGAQGGNLIF
jgi:hypothetical protein